MVFVSYWRVTLSVSREEIASFADAIGSTSDTHRDPHAAQALGYPDVVAPPTFPIVVTGATLQQLLDDPDAGVDFTRVVHGDQIVRAVDSFQRSRITSRTMRRTSRRR